MKYETITIRVPADLKKSAEKAAKAEDRSLTKFICRALQANTDTHPWRDLPKDEQQIALDKLHHMKSAAGEAAWYALKSLRDLGTVPDEES